VKNRKIDKAGMEKVRGKRKERRRKAKREERRV